MTRTTIVSGMAALLLCGPTFAQDQDPLTRAHARRIAITVCATCHGRTGVSDQPKFPNLAAQKPAYLAAQLKAFKSQRRGDSDALSYMWGMSAPLEDATIEALAAYYGSLPPPAARSTDSEVTRQGREIYEKGIKAIGVPACATCHAPDGHGLADFPRIAGQTSQYVMKQLQSFQSNMRNVAVMHGVAEGLKDKQMHAVSAYLETLP